MLFSAKDKSASRGLVTALVGGTFDPVHFGHIRPALELLSCGEIATVRFIPCAVHPDKGVSTAGAKARIEMLRLINHDGLYVDTRETDRGGVSYTVDTVAQIRDEAGCDAPLAFVVGEDVLGAVEDWEHAERMAALVHLIVLRRPGCASPKPSLWSQVADMEELSRHPGGRLLRFANQLTDISSTAIRRMLARGEQPRHMMPGVVWNYIRRHRLYGWKEPDAI